MSDPTTNVLLGRRNEPKPMEHYYFDFWRRKFDDLGWRDAADNVSRYLGATGAEKVYSEEQIEVMPPITYRIDRDNTLFEGRTFTGRTDDKAVNQALLSLEPGQKINFRDKWQSSYSPKQILPNAFT